MLRQLNGDFPTDKKLQAYTAYRLPKMVRLLWFGIKMKML